EQELPGIERIGDWLGVHIPSTWEPAIMHGDYHLANLFIAPAPPARVAAILDWENATIGDPLLDLATFLRLLESRGRVHWGAREDLIARWEETSGRRAPDLRYWTALSAYKLSIMLEGVYRRSLADPTRGDASGLGDTALQIMREAQQTIHG
ncbi:MAG: phosphotransferase, partial [Myxococcota bacterium]